MMKKFLYLLSLTLLTFPLSAADYYWIGGNGSWSNISNWATTSGGVVTHNTAPTAEDNVIFDANSFTAPGQVVSLGGDIAFCRDMRWETGTQGATFSAAASATLSVFGGIQLSTEMTFDFRGDVRFQGSNTGNIIDLAGQPLLRNVTFDGTGAAWTLDDDFQVIGLFYYYSGTLISAGNDLICERFYGEINSANSRLNLNGSTVTLTGIDEMFVGNPHTVYLSTNFDNVFVLDEAQFVLNGSRCTFRYFYNNGFPSSIGGLTFRSETGQSEIRGNAQHPLVLGRLDIQNNGIVDYDLEVDSLILGGGKSFVFVNGRRVDFLNLEVQGTCQEPTLIQSDRPGTPFLMNAPASGTIAVNYASIQDVTAAGGADFVAENSVDLGNNTGWTINTKTYNELYWVGGTGMWDDPANWSFTSGGPGGACIPTPGEDVIFDVNSFNGPLDIVMINVENAYCQDMRWENVSGMPALNGGVDQNIRIFGSLALSPQMTYNFDGDLYFQSNAAGNTIRTAGHELKKDVLLTGLGGWTLEDDLFLFRYLDFLSGSLNTNDQDLSFREFRSEVTTDRQLFLTSSQIELRDTTFREFLSWRMNNLNLDFDAGTSKVIFNNTGSIELSGSGSSEFHHVVMMASGYQNNYTNNPSGYLGMDTLELYGWHRFNNHIYPQNLIINPGYELRIEGQDTLTFDSLAVLGGCGSFAEISSRTLNTPVVIRPTRPNQVSNLIIRDLHNNTGIPLTLDQSVDLGNNLGWAFNQDAGRTLYWVGDGGEWNDPVHWSLSSGGPGGECPPGPSDNIYFDGNSFSMPGQTVNGSFTYTYCHNMDWSGAAFNPRFEFYEHQNFGSVQMIDGMSLGGLRLKLRTDSMDVPVDTRGLEFSLATFEGNGSWILSGTIDVYALEFEAGELVTNGQELFTERVAIYGQNTKTLDMSGSYWHFEGKRSEFEEWYVDYRTMEEVIVGNSVVDLESEDPEIRLFGAFSFDHLLASNTRGSTQLNNFLDVNQADSVLFNTLELRNSTIFTGSMYGDTILLAAGKTFQLDPGAELRGGEYIQMIGNNCTPIELKSKFSGQQADLVSPQGIVKADFVQMQDVRAVGEEPFYAGIHSTDIGNNSNWIFDSAEEFVEEGFLGQDKVLCDATGLTLDANNFSPDETYRWQDGSTDSIFMVDQPGLYFVEVNFTNNCAIRDSVNVLPPNDFTPQLPDTLNLLCEGDTLLLDASLDLVGLSYLWQDSTTSATFPVSSSGEYKVTLELGGCFSSDSTMVQLVAYPGVDLGPDQTLCADSTFTLDATTDTATYRWQDNSQLATFEVNSPGIYWADVSYGKCTTRDSVSINYFAPIPLDLGNDTTICEDASLLITGGLANAAYTWSDGSTGNSISVSTVGTYGVEALVNNCPAYDSITVSIQELPRFELGTDTAICEGESLLLDGSSLPGTTYEWSTGSTDPTLSVATAGVYALQASLNGCTFADTRTLSINPLPTVDLGPDQVLCEEEQRTLDVGQAGATYSWQDGSEESTFVVSMAGSYAVRASLNGCTAEDSVRFNFNPLPRFELGADTAICAGESLLLDGTSLPGATYEWSDGSSQATLSVDTEGTYALEASLDGCTFSDARFVRVKPLPIVDLGADRVLCEGETEILDVSQANASYQWQDGSGQGTFTANQTGTFGVTVNLEGCTTTDSLFLRFNPAPGFDLGNDTLLCEGENLLLNGFVNATTTYRWNDGTTNAQLNVSRPGVYSLETTDNGCSFNDEITVTYGIIPDDLLGMDRILCEEDVLDFNLAVPNASRYEWIDGQQSANYTISSEGTYGVRVSVDRCTGGDTINVTYNPLPRFDLGSDTSLCEGETLALQVEVLADSYQWQDGTNTASYQVTLPGAYSATATLDGCSFTDQLVVDYQASRSFSLGPDTTICEEDPFMLSIDQRADRIEWQDGSTGRTYTVAQAGIYGVVVQDGACTFSDSIRIETRECFRFQVYAPTAFSPNGDGVNDEFLIGIPPNMQVLSYEMNVFDRWGNRIFTSENINEGWNGLTEGEDLPVGVYIYSIRIRYRDDYREDEEIFSGDVLLIK